MSLGIHLLKFQRIIKLPLSRSSSQWTALLLGMLDPEYADTTILLKCLAVIYQLTEDNTPENFNPHI